MIIAPNSRIAHLTRKLLNRGLTIEQVVSRFQHRYTREELLQAVVTLRETAIEARKRHRIVSGPRIVPYVRAEFVPPAVGDDARRRRNMDHPTFVGKQMGDPLPGYSMADRDRTPVAPAIISDPLDALVFRSRGARHFVLQTEAPLIVARAALTKGQGT